MSTVLEINVSNHFIKNIWQSFDNPKHTFYKEGRKDNAKGCYHACLSKTENDTAIEVWNFQEGNMVDFLEIEEDDLLKILKGKNVFAVGDFVVKINVID